MPCWNLKIYYIIKIVLIVFVYPNYLQLQKQWKNNLINKIKVLFFKVVLGKKEISIKYPLLNIKFSIDHLLF